MLRYSAAGLFLKILNTVVYVVRTCAFLSVFYFNDTKIIIVF